MSKVTENQLLFLDNLIYLDLLDFDNATIHEVIVDVLSNIDKYIDPKNLPASMTKEQWVSLLTSFKDNPANAEFLENYVGENYVTDDTDDDGFRASCFVNKNDKTDVVVVFRGSYGGTEWEDNLLIANDIWSEHMDKGVNYINEYLPEEEYGNNIIVTGHSKGGNRAQYVTIVTDRIGRCVSKVLFGTSIGFADEVDKELNFVENYQNGNIDFFVYIFTENDTKEIEEDINGMINDFKSNDNELWIRNVITNNLSEVSKSSINTIRDDFSKYCIKEISYSTEIDNK